MFSDELSSDTVSVVVITVCLLVAFYVGILLCAGLQRTRFCKCCSDQTNSSSGINETLQIVVVCDTDVCSICLECEMNNARVAKLACGHIYHETCIKEWFNHSISCPLCRHC